MSIIHIYLVVKTQIYILFYPALILFEQSNCIDWINVCYVRSLTKIQFSWYLIHVKQWKEKVTVQVWMSQRTPLKTIRVKVVSALFRHVQNKRYFSSFETTWQLFWELWYCSKNPIYVHCLNMLNSFGIAVKQERNAYQMLSFLPVSKAHRNKLYIFQLCTYIVYLQSLTA